MTNQEPIGTTYNFPTKPSKFPYMKDSSGTWSLEIETSENKFYSKSLAGHLYAGGKNYLSLRGYISDAKAVNYPKAQWEIMHQLRIEVLKDCRFATPIKSTTYTNFIHYNGEYIVDTADPLTGAAQLAA